MKRSKRLTPVVDIFAKATQSELLKMGEANRLCLKEKQQLHELEQYKAEYLARFRQDDGNSMTAQKILELRGFMTQLDHTIAGQQQQVTHAEQQLNRQRVAWQQKRVKEEAMQSLMTRYQQQETLHSLKKEQQQNDERNVMLWRHRQD